jgi:hypothetical protein
MSETLKISTNYSAKDFLDLGLKPTSSVENWHKAIEIFKARFDERYFRVFDKLMELDEDQQAGDDPIVPGFAILSLCFLLAETLMGFREGVANHQGESKKLSGEFWKRVAPELDDDDIQTLYGQGRCGLLHSASSDSIRVVKSESLDLIMKRDRLVLNRSKFVDTLKEEFKSYTDELREGKDSDLRKKFITKMEKLCDTCDLKIDNS